MLYRFQDCELDDSLYQLRRSGKPTDIEPRVFDVLAYLLQHRERVVPKDELLEKLWSGQVVSETALTRCIVAARKAVGDDGSKQGVIETQHGRGYRFVASVSERVVERKLAAIFHADVKGYSRLMGEDEVTTLHTVASHLDMMRTLVKQHGGRAIGSRGDSLLAEFPSVVEAVQGAVEMQQELKVRNATLPVDRRVEFRIGINVGEVVVEGEEIYGDGVNVAVRLEGIAEAGGICISEMVYKQIKNRLALGYEDLGERTLKNIAEPVRVYRVQMEPTAPAPTVSRELPLALALSDEPSIAVLPFVNLSGDPEQEYFSDGLTEDLITDLSRLSGLFVIARHSVFTYKGKAVKIEEVSRELEARYVLEGSVRKAGDRVRITAQLVDATTGRHLWAERYDRDLQDIFALQDEITQKIVAALAVKLTAGKQERVGRQYTDSLEAYDYYLRGLAYYFRYTKETNAQAQQMFERALELDPQFAAAYAYLGWTRFTEWGRHWSQDPQSLKQTFALAQRAIALDASLPVTRGLVREHVAVSQSSERPHALGTGSESEYPSMLQLPALYFERLLQSSLDIVVAVDQKGQIIFYNDGANKTLGYTLEEVRGKHVTTVYPSLAEARKVVAALRSEEFGEKDKLKNFATVLVSKSGEQIPVVMSGSVIYDEVGAEIGIIGFLKDLRDIQ
jgi:adenylate cyclase